MEKFFPADKIIMTGNPVRQNLLANKPEREEAVASFGFNPEKKTILILGGSLGARTINQTLIAALDTIKAHSDVQFIWQTGKIYIQQIKDAITTATGEAVRNPRIPAIPISEFCLLNKPVILVPSPNVAEDHQTKNALALVDKKAAIYVKDVDAMKHLVSTALATVADDDKLKTLSENIATLALPDSATIIAKEVLKLIDKP